MPYYEYVCQSCGKDFALLQSLGAREEETACPYCDARQARKKLTTFSSGGTGHSVCGIGSGGWGGG